MAVFLVLSGCSGSENTTADNQRTPSFANDNPVVQLQNGTSANANCALAGGMMALSRQLNGVSVGTCQLANGKRCDERSLMNGTCPAG